MHTTNHKQKTLSQKDLAKVVGGKGADIRVSGGGYGPGWGRGWGRGWGGYGSGWGGGYGGSRVGIFF